MLKFLKLILIVALLIALFSMKQVQTILFIAIFLFVLYLPKLMQVLDDLKWISASLVNEEKHRQIKEEAERYTFILENIKTGKIRKNMSINELKKILEEFKKGPLQLGLYLGEGKANKVKKVHFFGYGLDFPSPQLTLFLREDRLIGWRINPYF